METQQRTKKGVILIWVKYIYICNLIASVSYPLLKLKPNALWNLKRKYTHMYIATEINVTELSIKHKKLKKEEIAWEVDVTKYWVTLILISKWNIVFVCFSFLSHMYNKVSDLGFNEMQTICFQKKLERKYNREIKNCFCYNLHTLITIFAIYSSSKEL